MSEFYSINSDYEMKPYYMTVPNELIGCEILSDRRS